jgi:phosphatidylserine/phosphatidylglycerophosphate/cardiolipin synthase-like enzyme
MFDQLDRLPELVITAPEPYAAAIAHFTRTRMTLGVLTQLIAGANRHVVIAAPFMQAGYGLGSGPISDAVRSALQRGAMVDVVSTGRGLQSVDFSSLGAGAVGSLRLFRPEANLTNEEILGSHAKFCVADAASAYVGSANLTGPGLSKHLELGVLVHGATAKQIYDFWLYTVDLGLFIPVG